MLNTCMYIITRAGRAGPSRAGHVRQLDEGAACMLAGKLFYSVCGCQRQGVAVASYSPLFAPIHRLPFGMPRAPMAMTGSRPSRFKGACMRTSLQQSQDSMCHKYTRTYIRSSR